MLRILRIAALLLSLYFLLGGAFNTYEGRIEGPAMMGLGLLLLTFIFFSFVGSKCASCGSMILFGGKKYGEYRFCNDKCQQEGIVNQLPNQVFDEYLHKIHQGYCPQCHGPGPVDVHTSYRVASALIAAEWSSRPQICCQSCGTKSKIRDALYSLVLGWWSIPGLLITPVQIIRNVMGLFTPPDPLKPSQQLKTLIKQHFDGQ